MRDRSLLATAGHLLVSSRSRMPAWQERAHMRIAILLLLLTLGQPVFAVDDEEDVHVFDRTVVINATNKSRADLLKEAFAQAGATLEFDRPALASVELVLNEKITRDFGEMPLREAMLLLLDYPRTEGVGIRPDGDGWVLSSLALLKTRRDQFSPD